MKEVIEYVKLIFKRNKKIFLLSLISIFLVAVMFISVFTGWLHIINEGALSEDAGIETENVPNFGTQIQTETNIESVPNFGTEIVVLNLEDMAKPMLEEKTILLEKDLSEYALRNDLEEESIEIISIIIPVQNENQVFFFCEFTNSHEIVQVVFDREKDIFVTLKSHFKKEDILNEAWNGICPSDRDIQE